MDLQILQDTTPAQRSSWELLKQHLTALFVGDPTDRATTAEAIRATCNAAIGELESPPTSRDRLGRTHDSDPQDPVTAAVRVDPQGPMPPTERAQPVVEAGASERKLNEPAPPDGPVEENGRLLIYYDRTRFPIDSSLRQGWEILLAMWPPADRKEVDASEVKSKIRSKAKDTKNLASKANQVLRQMQIGFSISKKEGEEKLVWRRTS
jgi:hypothetical protein